MTTSVRISGVLWILGAVGACAGDPDEATSDEAVEEVAADLEVAGPMGGGGPMGDGFGPAVFLRCDPDPEIVFGEVCGRSIPISAHFEWQSCDGPTGPSSGVVDVAASGDPSDCGSIERQVTLALTRTLPGGGATADVSGQLTVVVELGPSGPSRRISGEVAVALPGGAALAVAIDEVLLVSPEVCGWPIDGSVDRTMPDGSSHRIEFGPECGQATVDGQLVDLASSNLPFGPG